jgi:hypothetical protein
MNVHAMKTTLARVALLGGFALALSGCYETVGGDRTQPFAANSNGVEQARVKIQQTCAYEPATYFGVGSSNMQERCACYASGVVKLMSKEELDYYANYGLIPTLSKDKYNEVKNRCAAGTATPAPGDKPQKQKGGKAT